MELIPINEYKLKIMLDEIDMKEYSLGERSDCADAETRKAIRDILAVARDRIGFNTEGAEIFVQLYTSKTGGCELFVTKGETANEKSGGNAACSIDRRTAVFSDADARTPTRKKKEAARTQSPSQVSLRTPALPQARRADIGRLTFSFDSVAMLCKVCAILQSRNASLESRALTDDMGNYYLVLYGTGMSAYSRLDKLSFISEYGERESAERIDTYLGERGRVICDKNAIGVLGAL